MSKWARVQARLQTQAALLPQRAAAALRLGAWPDFVIIGGQRCGTTSLYDYLTQHREIVPAARKEIHYFDNHYDRGAAWYRAFFYRAAVRRVFGPCLTGEATPYYLFHPHAAARLAANVPAARLIVMLRNPIDRAYSHYLHEVRLGQETLPFAAAAAREAERVQTTVDALQPPGAHDLAHQHFTYLSRGLYAAQLRTWQRYFAREQMLIIISESFFTQPGQALAKCLAFLGVQDTNWQPLHFEKRNYHGPYEGIPLPLRRWLEAYFAAPNQALVDWLGYDPGW
ncbi:MAG: hypothetical protein Fur0021_09550 [Candidatus Promineifilaceae bacterium]